MHGVFCSIAAIPHGVRCLPDLSICPANIFFFQPSVITQWPVAKRVEDIFTRLKVPLFDLFIYAFSSFYAFGACRCQGD